MLLFIEKGNRTQNNEILLFFLIGYEIVILKGKLL